MRILLWHIENETPKTIYATLKARLSQSVLLSNPQGPCGRRAQGFEVDFKTVLLAAKFKINLIPANLILKVRQCRVVINHQQLHIMEFRIQAQMVDIQCLREHGVVRAAAEDPGYSSGCERWLGFPD